MDRQSPRKIIDIDTDAFHASVERESLALRGRQWRSDMARPAASRANIRLVGATVPNFEYGEPGDLPLLPEVG